jgi:prepilin-type N-terminal cleavage/methylation domain-containing protein
MFSKLREGSGREAFSLLELLIVIVIISVFYSLISVNFSLKKRESESVKLENLRRYPLRGRVPAEGAQLLCLNECRECYIYSGGKVTAELESALGSLKAYIVDKSGEAVPVDFGRFRDHRICLRFRYYPNGSSSEMIIESKGRFLYYPTLFAKVESFDSLEEAVTRWRRGEGEFTDKGDYY